MGLKDAEKQVDRAFTRDSYTGQSFENAFGGATSFLRLKYTKELNNVDLAITGIPFDQAVTNRPGSRFGPRAIREASTLQPYTGGRILIQCQRYPWSIMEISHLIMPK